MSLVLFDYDGVLADTLDDLIQFGQEACDALGINHVVTQEDLSNLEVMSFATYAQACDVPDHLVGRFVQYCLKRFADKESPPAIFNGLRDIVRQIALNNTIVIITTNTSENVNAFLVENGLDDCVDAVFGVDMPGTKTEKIAIAREQFSSDAIREPVIMVGDSLSDIRAAKAASVISVAVAWGHQNLKRLLLGDPDHVAHIPEELLELIEKIERAMGACGQAG